MKSIVCKRIEEQSKLFRIKAKGMNTCPITCEDIREFLYIANIFDLYHGETMTYPIFKKYFFPQHDGGNV